MIISRGRAYIFVHIPKTGGTAMALALEARAMKDDILIGDTPKALRRRRRLKGANAAGRLWKHSTLADIEGLVGREEFDDFLIFTLVRNPWDRLVSLYHWLRAQAFDHPAVGRAKRLDFSGYLNAPETAAALAANPYRAYLRDGGGVERATHYVRIERFRDDIAPIEAHLGFALDLPRANASERPDDYRAAFSDADAALVGQLCQDDIAAFGYRFDGPIGAAG